MAPPRFIFLVMLCVSWCSESLDCLTLVSVKMAHFLFACNVDMCQPIFRNFWQTHCNKFATRGYIINLPHTVSVTALPCKILITTLIMFTVILVHSKCKNLNFKFDLCK